MILEIDTLAVLEEFTSTTEMEQYLLISFGSCYLIWELTTNTALLL